MKQILDIVNSFFNNKKSWDKILIEINFTEAGGYEPQFTIIKDSEETLWTDFELFDIADIVHKKQKKELNTSEKFNKAKIEIFPDETFSEYYWLDSDLENQYFLNYAQVFYQWVNERMMSMIFEYEKDNKLIPTQYDADGDLEYLSSWDSGVFTFHINSKNELDYNIVLTKDRNERTVEMLLKNYFIASLLEHHQITNTVLSNEWKRWNTMIVKSPHYDIPYDKREEFVCYIME